MRRRLSHRQNPKRKVFENVNGSSSGKQTENKSCSLLLLTTSRRGRLPTVPESDSLCTRVGRGPRSGAAEPGVPPPPSVAGEQAHWDTPEGRFGRRTRPLSELAPGPLRRLYTEPPPSTVRPRRSLSTTQRRTRRWDPH